MKMMPPLYATLAFSLAACGMENAKTPDGLSLDIEGRDHVAGTFTKENVTLVFDLWASPTRATRVGTLETADGHLMTSTLVGDHEKLTILDGRLTVEGAPGSLEPEITGDRAAMAEMTETPEAKLVPDLRAALSERGVDDELHTPDPAKNSVSSVYWSNGWWHLAPGESKSFPTWTFWYPTNFYIKNFGGTCATFDVWSNVTSYVGPIGRYQTQLLTGYFWGFPAKFSQLPSYVQWDGYGVCVPGDIGISAG